MRPQITEPTCRCLDEKTVTSDPPRRDELRDQLSAVRCQAAAPDHARVTTARPRYSGTELECYLE